MSPGPPHRNQQNLPRANRLHGHFTRLASFPDALLPPPSRSPSSHTTNTFEQHFFVKVRACQHIFLTMQAYFSKCADSNLSTVLISLQSAQDRPISPSTGLHLVIWAVTNFSQDHIHIRIDI